MQQHLNELRVILSDVLGIGERLNSFEDDSVLLGNIPEFDSVAVVSLISALENYYNIKINDDEISAKTFETLNSLSAFIEQKRAENQVK